MCLEWRLSVHALPISWQNLYTAGTETCSDDEGRTKTSKLVCGYSDYGVATANTEQASEVRSSKTMYH